MSRSQKNGFEKWEKISKVKRVERASEMTEVLKQGIAGERHHIDPQVKNCPDNGKAYAKAMSISQMLKEQQEANVFGTVH